MIYFVKVIYLSAVRSEVCAVDSFGFPVIRSIDSCVMTSRRTHVDEIEIYASSKFWKSFGRYYRWQAFLVTSPYRCKNEFCSQNESPEKEFVLEKNHPKMDLYFKIILYYHQFYMDWPLGAAALLRTFNILWKYFTLGQPD